MTEQDERCEVLYTGSLKQRLEGSSEKSHLCEGQLMNWKAKLKLELSIRIYNGFHLSGSSVRFHKRRPSEYRLSGNGVGQNSSL